MSTPHPGWYPDPEDASRARYWDGERWTDRTGERAAIEGAQSAPQRPPAPPAQPPVGRPWWKRPLVPALGVALLALGAAAFVLLSSSEARAEVVLEPTGTTSADPFTESVATGEVNPGAGGMGVGEIDDPRTEQVEAALAGNVVESSAPALYGGSRDTQVCETRQLRRFLTDEANAAQASAWATALGISVESIPDYLRELTAVRLSFDTRVTNHGFTGSEANPFQALLQAGTAVLVDDRGMPAVKCDCGNPLLAPTADEALDGSEALAVDDLAANPGDAWQDFDPAQAVSVRPGGEPLDEITLNDFDSDGLLERPVGSDGQSARDTGTGDVQVKLEWESDADLDLHVTEPSGTEIWYQAKGPTRSGGQLDVDSNVGCDEDGSVENVFWPAGGAPDGDYTVEVVGFTVDGCGSGDFTLTIDVVGQEEQVFTGSVGEDEEVSYSFSSDGQVEAEGSSGGAPDGSEPSEGEAPSEPAADESGSSDWPAGEEGHTVVLASKPSRSAAVAVAEQARAAGLSEVGVLRSDDHSSLNPGFWVAYSGVLSESAADDRRAEARGAGFSDAYVRLISGG